MKTSFDSSHVRGLDRPFSIGDGEAEKLHSLSCGTEKDFLRMNLNGKCFLAEVLDVRQKTVQVVPVIMENHDVIHEPKAMLEASPVNDKMIEFVQIKVRENL